MGEYAKFNGQEIKIGTCESMYYLRLEDAAKVQPVPNSLNPATCEGLCFRLPFPDEDAIEPGHYDNHDRGLRLGHTTGTQTTRPGYFTDYTPEWLAETDAGNIQLRHEQSGLLLNVPCHHGARLPETGPEIKAFWNGKGHSIELSSVKRLEGGEVLPVIRCRHCGSAWRSTWADVLPEIFDKEMHKRLAVYAELATA